MTLRNTEVRPLFRQHRARMFGMALPACGAIAACSSAPTPPPDAYVAATLGPSLDMNPADLNVNLCSYASATSALAIGSGTRGAAGPTTQPDGSSQGPSATVNVVCSVTGGFQVTALASLGGNTPGSLQLAGNVNASTGAMSSIHADLSANGGSFSEDDCTITYTYMGMDVPTTAVAPGRIWGHVSCPTMTNEDGVSVHLADGTTPTEQCDMESDFLFENCAQ